MERPRPCMARMMQHAAAGQDGGIYPAGQECGQLGGVYYGPGISGQRDVGLMAPLHNVFKDICENSQLLLFLGLRP